jgi:hypothetical protein
MTKHDIHRPVKRIFVSPDLSKMTRIQLDSHTIIFKDVIKTKKSKRQAKGN